MSFEQRIARLKAEGKLTQAQFKDLQEGVAALDGTPAAISCRRKILPSSGSILIAAAVVLGALILTFSGTNDADQTVIQTVSETMNQTGGVGAMNRSLVSLISVFVVFIPFVLAFMWLYNGLVAKEEDVMSAWAQVETNYQRRADLVPGLVSTVKAFAEHETQILSAVTESRAKAQSTKADPNDAASLKAMEEVQKTLGLNLVKLMAVAENYPQLRSADNFLALQDQLEGTENRINTARMVFNDAVNDYNAAIRKMPDAWVAGLGHFQRKAYFEADSGSQKAPSIDFTQETDKKGQE